MKNIGLVLVGLLVTLMLLTMSLFIVDQREYALVFRLGEIAYPISIEALELPEPSITQF